MDTETSVRREAIAEVAYLSHEGRESALAELLGITRTDDRYLALRALLDAWYEADLLAADRAG